MEIKIKKEVRKNVTGEKRIKKKINKSLRFFVGAFVVFLIVACCASVTKAESYISDKNGSIQLTMQQSDSDGNVMTLPGISITLYKAGDVEYDKGAVKFSFYDELGLAETNLNKVDTASGWQEASEKAADAIKTSELSGEEKTSDQDGEIIFDNLTQGVYILVQSGNDEKIIIEPMLLTVPLMDSGEWIYDVNSYPKISTVKETETSTQETTSVHTDPTKTGDNNNMLMWLGMLVFTILIIAAAIIKINIDHRKL